MMSFKHCTPNSNRHTSDPMSMIMRFEPFFSECLQNANHYVGLAEIGGRAVGYVWFEFQERPQTAFMRPVRRIYVQHIAVHEDARRSGVASALMRALEDAARAKSVNRIVLDVWVANEDAQEFFRAKGFAPFNFVLEKNLA
jgi:ribosomal protein S18 acetylase RimI-like enzyme